MNCLAEVDDQLSAELAATRTRHPRVQSDRGGDARLLHIDDDLQPPLIGQEQRSRPCRSDPSDRAGLKTRSVPGGSVLSRRPSGVVGPSGQWLAEFLFGTPTRSSARHVLSSTTVHVFPARSCPSRLRRSLGGQLTERCGVQAVFLVVLCRRVEKAHLNSSTRCCSCWLNGRLTYCQGGPHRGLSWNTVP